MNLDIFSRSKAVLIRAGIGLAALVALWAGAFAIGGPNLGVALAEVPASAAGTAGAAGVSGAANYASIKALFDRRRYVEAAVDGRRLLATLKKGETDYTRTAVLVSMAAIKYQTPLTAAGSARDAYESDQGKNLVPVSNYGLLEIVAGDQELAFQLLQKAAQIAPDDFLTHVGLAQLQALQPRHNMIAALSELARAEAAPNTFGLSQLDKWCVIGDDYMLLDEPARALSAYQNAEKIADSDKDGRVRQSIYLAALAAGNDDLARKYLDLALASRVISPDALVLTARRLCPPTPEGTELAKRVFDIAATKVGDSDLMYKLARAFGTVGQNNYSRLCYEAALKLSPKDERYIVAYAGQLAKMGNNVVARRKLSLLAQRSRLEEPTVQHQLTQGLARAGLTLLDQYDSDWASMVKGALGARPKPVCKTAYARLHKVKCHCHLMNMQYSLRSQPGVVFAFIPDEKDPIATVVYDKKVANLPKIWRALDREAEVEPLGKEETLRDFADMVEFALNYSEAKYRSVNPYLPFNPLPLRPMG